MSELTLEPFAARVHFSRSAQASAAAASSDVSSVESLPAAALTWTSLTQSFIDDVARQVRETRAVIGHIKGLARQPGNAASEAIHSAQPGDHVLHFHSVSASRPTDVQGSFPESLAEMTLEMVVLAYGLPWEKARAIVESALASSSAKFSCAAHLEPAARHQSHTHTHQPHDHEHKHAHHEHQHDEPHQHD